LDKVNTKKVEVNRMTEGDRGILEKGKARDDE